MSEQQPSKPLSLGFLNLPNVKTILTKSTIFPPIPSLLQKKETVVSPEPPRIPKMIIDSNTSSSSSSSSDTENESTEDLRETTTEKGLDTVEHAMDPLIQLYVDQSASAIVLSGRDLSEQVLHINELVKEYDEEKLGIAADETKRLYDNWWSTITECLGGIQELKGFNEKNLLAKGSGFTKKRTKKPAVAEEAALVTTTTTKTSRKRKRRKSILAKGPPVKYKKKGPSTDAEIEFLIDCQIDYRYWLLAAEDDDGDYFDMTDVIKIMSIELERPAYGITKRLNLGKLRLKDNHLADSELLTKMKAAEIFPWPKPAQKQQRARLLHNISKCRKKQKRKRKH